MDEWKERAAIAAKFNENRKELYNKKITNHNLTSNAKGNATGNETDAEISKRENAYKEQLLTFDQEYKKFIQLFDDKMSAIEDQSHPIWKAYKVRYKEWQKVNSDLKLANYYMGMV